MGVRICVNPSDGFIHYRLCWFVLCQPSITDWIQRYRFLQLTMNKYIDLIVDNKSMIHIQWIFRKLFKFDRQSGEDNFKTHASFSKRHNFWPKETKCKLYLVTFLFLTKKKKKRTRVIHAVTRTHLLWYTRWIPVCIHGFVSLVYIFVFYF